ncbi:hypothetical protein PsYK624_124320 [Phanerochaete sordida]|uniref:Lytic polysaccharide monooxygenase n=1 Tax=Phanerochaete sordida TaxID=48140 RepID=A0A9P3LIJ7_9APHY|nr:hypothetical protein PsYK624_124320 [Phanerochaete sordida]
MKSALTAYAAVAALSPLALRVSAHASIWHKAMWGFNVTAQSYAYDNRPVVPLYNMPFSQWWMHGHLDHPPHPDDVVEFPAGGSTTIEISCDKGYTSWWPSSEGGNIQDPNSDLACPGQPTTAIHANDINDAAGCGIGIAYKSDINDVQPEDFVIFSVIHTCPWYLKNDFQVPQGMPACPDGKCICAFFWIHNPDSGGEQMYMNGFQCNITGDVGTTPIGKPGLARQCGADAASGHAATPSNCTIGPKNPMYWDQTERNNMFEGIYDAPTYSDRYGFPDGAQPYLFQDATVGGAPAAVSQSSPPASSAAPAPPASSAAAPPADSSPAAPAPPPPSSEAPAPPPTTSAAAPPPPPPSSSTEAAVTTSTVSPVTEVATTSAAAATPAATKKCRARNGKKKRSAAQRHLKKRLTHDGLSVSH